MDQGTLRSKLKVIAHRTADNFFKRSQKLSIFERYFGSVDQKEKAIREAIARIDGPAAPSSAPLIGASHAVCSFLEVDDLSRVASVNKTFSNSAQKEMVVRAKKYGYQENIAYTAKNFLMVKLYAIEYLAKDLIKVVSNDLKTLFFKKQYESILKYIQSDLGFKDRLSLTELLFKYVNYSKIDGNKIRAVLKLGADINFQNSKGETPLLQATRTYIENTIRFREQISGLYYTPEYDDKVEASKITIKILLDQGADPNIFDNAGNSPLSLLSTFPHRDPRLLEDLQKRG